MRDYIVILSDIRHFPQQAIQLATLLADGFNKEICFLSFASNENTKLQIEAQHQRWIKEISHPTISLTRNSTQNLHEILTEIEAAFLIIEPAADSTYNKTQQLLNLCKPLRIPYFFVKPDTKSISFNKVLVPIGFLTEEKEKGIFASKLARFCNATITLLQANDYGSRAKESVNQIQLLLEKFGVTCQIKQARKDSFKVQHEASSRACNGEAGLIIITASREYGLDDVIFGPPERKIIQQSTVPVMVINPRPDLYVLCD